VSWADTYEALWGAPLPTQTAIEWQDLIARQCPHLAAGEIERALDRIVRDRAMDDATDRQAGRRAERRYPPRVAEIAGALFTQRRECEAKRREAERRARDAQEAREYFEARNRMTRNAPLFASE